jgi:hypothetical protein
MNKLRVVIPPYERGDGKVKVRVVLLVIALATAISLLIIPARVQKAATVCWQCQINYGTADYNCQQASSTAGTNCDPNSPNHAQCISDAVNAAYSNCMSQANEDYGNCLGSCDGDFNPPPKKGNKP